MSEDGPGMKAKGTFVKVLVAAVLASGAWGALVFAAGEERTFPKGGAASMPTEPKGEEVDWAARFEAKLAELRARGEPVTFEEVMAGRVKLPDSENSALIFLRAFEARDRTADGLCLFIGFVGEFPADAGLHHPQVVLEAMRDCLQANAKALSLIHEGARLPHGVYPLNVSANPYETLMEHLAPLRQAARLCIVEVALSAHRGDGAAAAESLFAIRRLSSSIGGCPFLIEGLVRIAADRILGDTLEKTLALCEMPPEKLQMLSREIAVEEAEASLLEAMRIERADGHWIFTRTREEIMTMLPSEAQRFPPRALERDQMARDALSYHGHIDEAVRIAALPDREQLGEAARLGRQIAQTPPELVLTSLLTPALERALTEGVKARTRLRVARAGLAVEQWRMKNGRWPQRLEDLVPEFLNAVPQDPYSDGTIGYSQTEHGAVILYSVGPDGKYSGGRTQEEAPAHQPEAYDLLFRLLPPKERGVRQIVAADWRDYGGTTLLHKAARAGAAAMIERLLAAGLDVDVRDSHGRTPLHDAAQAGQAEFARLLIEKGADVNAKDRITFHLEYQVGDGPAAHPLPDKGGHPEVREVDNWTPLHLAAMAQHEGHRDVAEVLLQAGADVNARDAAGETPTRLARRMEHNALAAFLAEHGGVE